MDDVIATILKSGGPENNGTQAEAVKWHDDKVSALQSLYCSTHLELQHQLSLLHALQQHEETISCKKMPWLGDSPVRRGQPASHDYELGTSRQRKRVLNPTRSFAMKTLKLFSPPAVMQSLYTGVYGKGGPTNVDMDPTNLAGLCDRSSADVRGVKNAGGSNPGSRRATTEGKIPAARRSTAESSTGALSGAVKNMKI